MINITGEIRNLSAKRLIIPTITFILMILSLMIFPFFKVFNPEPISNIYNVRLSDKYVKVTAKTLHYSGYNLIKFGNKKYGYYYALNDNQCVFVILPVGSTPKKTLTNYSFKGKVIKPNSSYKEMLDAFSKDLNWDSQSLSKITGECLISNANYHPIKYMIFMWFVIVIMLISLKNIVEAIMGIVNPYLYPVCTFLNKQLGKEYIDDAESELSFGNYIQINSIYITENYCIDLGKNKISILPLNDIVWCYRLGNISLNPKNEEPTFSLHFTLIDGSTILFKKKTSDEALEAINAIRATEYNIIIGHSESKKKAAKAVINSYKQK